MKKYLFLLIILFNIYTSKSDLLIEIQQVTWAENIATGESPYITAKIRTKKDAILTAVTKEELIIYENWVDGTKPIEVSGYENGWQTVKWIPENIYWDSTLYRGKIIWTLDGESASSDFLGYIGNFSVIRINDQDETSIKEINFGNIPPNNKVPYQIHFYPSFLDKSTNKKIHIDSITTSTKYFYVGAKGSLLPMFDFPNTPCDIYADNGYYINVMFEPDSYEQFYDMLTIHYNHGLKKQIPIFANKAEYEKETVLHLIKPNGSEILTPCEEYELKWENHSKSTFVNIYYSIDAGRTWKFIDKVKDSIYKWRVPSEITNSAQIKIIQELSESRSFNLNDVKLGINQVAYNQNGSKLIAVAKDGETIEYDLYSNATPQAINRWFLTEDGETPTEDVFGLEYVSGDSIIAVGYNIKGNWGQSDQAYIAYFKGKETSAFKKLKVMDKFSAKRMLVDKQKRYLVFVPDGISATLPIYNPIDFSVIKVLKFDSPIIDFAFNTQVDKALIALMDGNVLELSTNDFSTITKYDISKEYLPICIGYAPNAKLMSLGFKNMGGLTNNYIYDLSKKHVVSNIQAAGSNPVVHTFSPESRQFVLGSKYQEQLMLVDLTGEVKPTYLASHLDGRLTDVEFAPDAHSLASTSSSPNDNLKFRIFAFPDFDKSDGLFNIVPVQVAKPVQNIAEAYLGTHNDYVISNVCNEGLASIVYKNLRMKKGLHFKLKNNNKFADTIKQGACGSFELDYFPTDIGTLTDSLVFTVCGIDYFIPIQSKGLPRNIQYTSRELNFGDVCLGETNPIRSIIFTNLDPVPLIIDKFEFSGIERVHFRREDIKDTIIPAGASLEMTLEFLPQSIGDKVCDLLLYHSNQSKFIEKMTLKGRGIGTYIDLSHTKLLFIPEIKTRKLKLKNTGLTPIQFDNVNYSPEGFFETVSQLPFTVAGKDSFELEIRQLKSTKSFVSMSIDATPCLVQRSILLGDYDGNASVKIADVKVKPDQEVYLPITAEIRDNIAPYNGKRFFEAYIRTNPRLFIPIEITTKYDKAEILENIIDGNDRLFKIRVEGNFSGQNEIATIKGIPGYAETNYTDLVFDNASIFFSKSIMILPKNGSLTIDLPFPDRKIYRNSNNLIITGISPNPATDYIDINFVSASTGICKVEVINQTGNVVANMDLQNINLGNNSFRVITSALNSNNYTIKLSNNGNIATVGFIILK